MDATDVLAATQQCERFLAAVVDADWGTRIPDMDWSVARAVAHMANVLLWYAFDLSAGGAEVDTLEMRVKPDSAPAQLIETLVAAARVVVGAIAASPPSRRGFHPLGQADPSEFAAMACDELLIHTDDAGRGLGRAFTPDPALCARVLARLFPETPAGVSPWDGLRWTNGRLALPGFPRRQTGSRASRSTETCRTGLQAWPSRSTCPAGEYCATP